MKRLGEPSEIADVVAWLGSYATSEIGTLDGGRMMLNYTVPVGACLRFLEKTSLFALPAFTSHLCSGALCRHNRSHEIPSHHAARWQPSTLD